MHFFFLIVIQKSKTISQIELQQLTDSNMLFDNSVKVMSVVIQLSWDVVGVTPLDTLPGPHKKTSNLTVTPTDKLVVEEKSVNTWRTCKLHRVKPWCSLCWLFRNRGICIGAPVSPSVFSVYWRYWTEKKRGHREKVWGQNRISHLLTSSRPVEPPVPMASL